MNKYQRVINKIARCNMQEPFYIKLMRSSNIKNSFKISRKIMKIITKRYSFEELISTRNNLQKQLKGEK